MADSGPERALAGTIARHTIRTLHEVPYGSLRGQFGLQGHLGTYLRRDQSLACPSQGECLSCPLPLLLCRPHLLEQAPQALAWPWTGRLESLYSEDSSVCAQRKHTLQTRLKTLEERLIGTPSSLCLLMSAKLGKSSLLCVRGSHMRAEAWAPRQPRPAFDHPRKLPWDDVIEL